MPSLAAILGQQDQNSLFGAVNRKTSLPASLAHKSLATKEAEQREEIAATGKVSRDMDAFRAAVAEAGSLEEALAKPAVHGALSSVYEIDILGKAPDRFAQMASSDPDDATSPAAKSRDTGMIRLAEDLKKSGDGLGLLKDADYLKALEDTLVSIEFETRAQAVSPEAADAFYFERKAPSLEGPMDILANPRVRDVVYGALGLGDDVKSQSVSKQAAVLGERLDFSKLTDADYVKQLSVDFINATERTNAQPSLAALLNGGAGSLFNTLA